MVRRMITNAEGGTGLLHRITTPTAWSRGVQIMEEEEEDAKQLARCGEKKRMGKTLAI